MEVAAWVYSSFLINRASPRMMRAFAHQPVMPMMMIRNVVDLREDREETDQEEQVGDRQERVEDAHHHGVNDAADEARDHAIDGAHDDGDETGQHAQGEGVLAAVHDAPELIEAAGVGAEQVRAPTAARSTTASNASA